MPFDGTNTQPFITVTKGMSGYFAVQMWWNTQDHPDLGGFWEPWDTGMGRYPSQQEAIQEAKEWADAECIRFVAPGNDS